MKTKSISKVNILVYITLILIIIYSNYNGCRDNKSYSQAIKAQNDSINYYKDKFGNNIAEKQAIEVTLKQAKTLNLFKDTEIRKLKNLVNLTEVNTIIRDSLIVRLDTILLKDSTKALKFQHVDRWINLTGIITDSVLVDYKIYEEFDIVAIRKAPKLFKKKVLVVDVNSKNPNSLVTNIQSIQIREPKKKFWETRGFAFLAGMFTNALVK